MSMRTKITLAKGGTLEQVVTAGEIQLPDLWHLAYNLKEIAAQKPRLASKCGIRPDSGDQLLELWHLAHDLLRTLQEAVDIAPLETLAKAADEE